MSMRATTQFNGAKRPASRRSWLGRAICNGERIGHQGPKEGGGGVSRGLAAEGSELAPARRRLVAQFHRREDVALRTRRTRTSAQGQQGSMAERRGGGLVE
eukprot:1915397-Pleurochrysis_carterae.AAC.1